MDVHLAAIASSKHEACPQVVLGGSIAEFLDGRDNAFHVRQCYDDVEVLVSPMLRTEERVDTPAAVEPHPYTALGERVGDSHHVFSRDHRAILTDDRNAPELLPFRAPTQ